MVSGWNFDWICGSCSHVLVPFDSGVHIRDFAAPELISNTIHNCQTVGIRVGDSTKGRCCENKINNCLESGAVASGSSETIFVQNVRHIFSELIS
jgi:hypothetical protein